ncbi:MULTISPECIES: hypothetical protein [unclassified Microcoleus]|uniref:hypothetical protein n=1 Tax=unclassified Microcoleus TaxID=2642155 RepID=UPI002FD09242
MKNLSLFIPESVKIVYLTRNVKIQRFNTEYGVTVMASAGVQLHPAKVSKN